MLGQRRRRWPNIDPALGQCLMHTDPSQLYPCSCYYHNIYPHRLTVGSQVVPCLMCYDSQHYMSLLYLGVYICIHDRGIARTGKRKTRQRERKPHAEARYLKTLTRYPKTETQ